MPVPLADLESVAQEIGSLIDSTLGDSLLGHRTVGFALLMFDFGEGGNMTYVSNAERQDMIKALEECLGNLRAGRDKPPIPPPSKRH